MTTPASSTSTVQGLNSAPNNSLASAVSAGASMSGASASTAPTLPTAPVTTPVLRSATALGTAANTTIDLEFDSAMLAGSGTIYVTDGAVQTVIDRTTGQPAMRVVGATDTRTISASSVSIDGNHVKLNVSGLQAGHQYSIVMAGGVLVSDAHVAFAGVRSTSQVQFTAKSAEGPALASKSIDNKTLTASGSLHAALTFTQAVTDLKAADFSAPNATIGKLTKLDADGLSWDVELLPSGAVEATGNMLALDMSKLHNGSGQAGTGSVNIGSYTVDTKGPAATIALGSGALTPGHDLVATVTFSEAVANLDPAALQAQNASVKSVTQTDDPKVWLVTLSGAASTTAGGSVLSLDMSKVGDLAGNPGSGIVKSAGYTVDTQAPDSVAIVLAGDKLNIGGSIGVTFTFSEAVKDFSGAINAPHAKVSDLKPVGDGHIWTATLQPLDTNTSTGNLVTLDMSKVEDLNGVHGSGSKVSNSGYAVDTQAPEVKAADIQLSGNLVSNGEAVQVTIKFSEKVSLDDSAIIAPYASVQGLHSNDDGLTWSALLRPSDPAEGTGKTVMVDMSRVHDGAGNYGSGGVSSTKTYDVDSKGPTAFIDLSGNELLQGGRIEVRISLSDRMSSGDLMAALTIPNASHTELTTVDDGLTWRTTLTPSGTGVVATNAVSLDLTKLHDAHGNAGTGSAVSDNYVVDNTVSTYVYGIGIDTGDSPFYGGFISNREHQTFSGNLSASIGDGQILRLTFDDDDGKDDPTDKHVDLAFDGDNWHLVGDTTSASEVHVGSAWNYGSALTDFADGVHTIRAQVIEGSHHSAAVNAMFTIDTAPPHLATSPDGQSGSANDDLVFTFDEAVYLGPSEGYYYMNFVDADGHSHYGDIYDSNLSADRKTLVIPASQHHMESGKNYEITFSWGLTDLAGNHLPAMDLHFRTNGVDTTPPRAYLATSLVGAGVYGIGKQIDIAVNFSEAVKVAGDGTPVLHLSNGGIAYFDHFTGDNRTMVFRYVVGNNKEDDTHDKDSLALKDNKDLAGHVSDLAGNLLDQAHIDFSGFGVPWVDGYGHLHSESDPDHPLQIDAHASPAPDAPMLDASSSTGAVGMTNQNKPLLTGAGAASFATVKLFDNGTLIAQTHAKADNTWQFDSSVWGASGQHLADGPHTLTVRQYDGANNESEASPELKLTVDTVKPDAPNTAVLASASDTGASDHDGITKDATPTLSGVAAEAGGKIELYLNDTATPFASTNVGADKTWSLTVPDTLALADATYNISVKQVDAAGNRSDSSATPLVVTIDTAKPTAPGKPVLSAASDSGLYDYDGITKVKTPTFTGKAGEAGGTVELYDGGTLLGTANVGADKSWSFTVGNQAGRPAELGEGEHKLTVKQVDAAGNSSDASVELKVTIDTGAPVIMYASWLTESGSNWLSLQFNEEVVFTANGSLDLLDAGNAPWAHYTSDVQTNWKIESDEDLVRDILDLSVHTTTSGAYHVAPGSIAIQDLAGNVAIIGSDPYWVGLPPH